MLRIMLNGEWKEFVEPVSVQSLIEQLNLKSGFAVALNNQVIPKSELMQTMINDGDHVEMIQATVGG